MTNWIPLKHLISYSITGLVIFLCCKTVFNFYLAQKRHNVLLQQNQQGDRFYLVEKIRPLVFMKIFANALTISFLPQYLIRITVHSGLAPHYSSIAYVFYQIIFIAMVIPGGYLVEVKNTKKILLITTMIEAVLVICFGLITHFWQILLLQVSFGLLTPYSAAAEHAYILQLSAEKDRSYAFSLYYNSFKGGMLSGVALGGMLSLYTGERGVFFIAGALILLTVMYILLCVPSIPAARGLKLRTKSQPYHFLSVLKKIPTAFTNLRFLKTATLIGFSLGFLNEGLILFGLPIILWHHHIPRDQIGFLLTLFSIGFLLTNKTIAKKADQWRAEKLFLALGLFGLSIGFFVLSYIGIKSDIVPQVGIIILGFALLLLGLCRGLLLAPGLSDISKNKMAKLIGKNVSLSVFNFFQTLGKISGPLLVMWLLVMFQYSAKVYWVASGIFLLFTLLFIIPMQINKCSLLKK